MEEESSQSLAAAIHETTNALTVILGWIERAHAATPGNDDAQKALARARRYTKDARAVMRRAIGASLPPRPPETVSSLAERAIEDLTVEAQRSRVELILDLDDDCAELLVPRPDAAWQILTNLLLNAVSVTPEEGTVLLEAQPHEDNTVLFRVADDGPGVPADLRETLFTAGVSRRVGGTGIGLRHAHGLARGCNGTLKLASESKDDTGAVFELHWPTAEHMAEDIAPTKATTVVRANLNGTHVLLLEDDDRVTELLELSLGARGAEVTSVKSAEALDDKLDGDGAFDVMLVDLSPFAVEHGEPTGLDGAIEKARRRNADIDVVVISGSVSARPRSDVIWVRKPFEPKELLEAMLKPKG